MAHKRKKTYGKIMEIWFRNPDVKTEEVREAIEDNVGVQIWEISERYPTKQSDMSYDD